MPTPVFYILNDNILVYTILYALTHSCWQTNSIVIRNTCLCRYPSLLFI